MSKDELELEEEYVKLLTDFIAGKEKFILNALDNYNRGRATVKALTESNLFMDFARILSPVVLITKLRNIVDQVITRAVESAEIDLNVNIPDFNPSFKEMTARANFDKIKGMTDNIAEELTETMLEGWRQGEGVAELKKRVKDVYSNGNITSARAEAIARTETNRMFNNGRLQAAKDSGLKLLKVWDAHIDSRTGSDSKALEKEYLHNGILLDDRFYDSVNNQFIDGPPNRPNCRCRLDFVSVGDEVVSAKG